MGFYVVAALLLPLAILAAVAGVCDGGVVLIQSRPGQVLGVNFCGMHTRHRQHFPWAAAGVLAAAGDLGWTKCFYSLYS